MSSSGGNEKWRALSDNHNRHGQPIERDQDALDELFGLLRVEQQQAVARGEISLEGLLEWMTTSDQELCPDCCSRPVAPRSRLGLCPVCARRRLSEALEAEGSRLEAVRDANAAKQRVRRLRDDINPDRPRRLRIMRACETCGRTFAVPMAVDPDATRCVTCRERYERRREQE